MHLHLIGICGTGMAGLAQLLVEQGHKVTGSDGAVYPPMSHVLRDLGIQISEGYSPANLNPTPQKVVVGNAIARGNPELEAALDGDLDYTSMAEVIEDLVLPGRHPIVVTGTHGKTTTTALITHLLRHAGRDPGWLVGGLARDLPSTAALGDGPEFVVEGDEYDTAYFDKRPKFHHYRPRMLLILNLEFDHADIYPDLDAIELEFRRLVNTVPQNGVILAPSLPGSARDVTTRAHARVLLWGENKDAQWHLGRTEWKDGAFVFLVHPPEGAEFEATIALPGRHNAHNALVALAAVEELGVERAKAIQGLASFRGVARRMENRGTVGGVTVWDDFAHHPTAIRASVEGLKQSTSAPIWAVLEPRSWTMRFDIHQHRLPDSLDDADHVILAPVFDLERVPTERRLDTRGLAEELRRRGRDAHAIESVDGIADYLAQHAAPGEQILLMSNGGFGGLHELLLQKLAQRQDEHR